MATRKVPTMSERKRRAISSKAQESQVTNRAPSNLENRTGESSGGGAIPGGPEDSSIADNVIINRYKITEYICLPSFVWLPLAKHYFDNESTLRASSRFQVVPVTALYYWTSSRTKE
ncbi:hypothetical protein LguiB_000678 [Lonicera macranthoides]